MAESTAVDVVAPENVFGILAEKAKDYFAKRCDEANSTFDCAEMVRCNRIATEVSVDPTVLINAWMTLTVEVDGSEKWPIICSVMYL